MARGRNLLCEGPAMGTSRSYYFNSRHNDFAEPNVDMGNADVTDIPYAVPANDNSRIKDKVWSRYATLLRRLIALRNHSWPRADY